MAVFQQGVAADLPLNEAIQRATDNSLRNHPGATVRFVRRFSTPALDAVGECFVELEVTGADGGEPARADLTDPAAVSARLRKQATTALLGLSDTDFASVMRDPAVAARRSETGTGGSTGGGRT